MTIDSLLDLQLKTGQAVSLHCLTTDSAKIFLKDDCFQTDRRRAIPEAAQKLPIPYQQSGSFGAIRKQGDVQCVVLTTVKDIPLVQEIHGYFKLVRQGEHQTPATIRVEKEILVPIKAIKWVVCHA